MVWRARIGYFIRTYGLGTAGAITALSILLHEKSKDKNVAYSAKREWSYSFEPSVKWDYNWDRREPENLVKPSKQNTEKDPDTVANELKSKTATATRHLLLIRHGQYNMESSDDIGRFLTKLGQEQADITGRRLKDLNLPYTVLISSTMTRAKETADIIHKHVPHLSIQRNDLLREGAPIPPEPASAHWRPEVAQFYKEGARIEAAFRKYFHRAEPDQTEDSYEIIVCHANVIRYFVCRALQFPPEGWLRMSLANGSITYLVIRPSGRVHIKTLGESGHMPVDKVTYT
ncbi:serine/threonine-protein phosphatase PGAM5, mitochondrial-like isoform X1 [Haliotis rufescens]|uniref:serine/threonine-protein phosphatase PGAM5, mitochondrial-like isoform X1 n=1 Tax=Haliotis rufescens TaxID=6454 RepID=UPI001EB04386|nr:serine/threonine-protein phosphatase PGAM5, mitochondrial-like isoform X1 [Haliotis rufescens]